MAETKILTLLTDFGLQDVYVGVMKGIIAQINPQLRIIDLTHQIPPQNLIAARFALMTSSVYFSQHTVHVAVVDPGVGSQRRCVAIEFAGGYLVGPDNGIFSGILSLSPPLVAVELTNSQYWLITNPSTTFHGRDIFAPVGAYLASGVPLSELGVNIDPGSLKELPLPQMQITETKIIGSIQYIDYFGNLISNIPTAALPNQSSWYVKVQKLIIPSGKTYSDAQPGEILALPGSHGWLELAVNCGSAEERLQLSEGDLVEVHNG